MRVVRIAKRKPGEFRTIYVPNKDDKIQFRSVAGELARKAERLCSKDVVHGFMQKRSCVTNAVRHIGRQYTTCFDLSDFFDSIGERHLSGKLTKKELSLVLVDGAPRQGLPTSPAVANIAASTLDKAILRWLARSGLPITFTRYGDRTPAPYRSWAA